MRIIRRFYIILLAAASLPPAALSHTAGGEGAQGDSPVSLRLCHFTPLPTGDRGQGAVWDFGRASVDGGSRTLRCTLHGDSAAAVLTGGTCATLTLSAGRMALAGYETPQLRIRFHEPPAVMLGKAAYGDSTAGTFAGTGEYCDRLRLRIDGRYTLAADGLGTLVTPDGDTIRGVTRLHGTRTAEILMWPLSLPSAATSAQQPDRLSLREDTYLWLAPGSACPRVVRRTVTDTGRRLTIADRAWYVRQPHEGAAGKPAGGTRLLSYRMDVADRGRRIDIGYTLARGGAVSLVLSDAAGIVYQSLRAQATAGQAQTRRIDCAALRPGQYILHISAPGERHAEKFVVE